MIYYYTTAIGDGQYFSSRLHARKCGNRFQWIANSQRRFLSVVCAGPTSGYTCYLLTILTTKTVFTWTVVITALVTIVVQVHKAMFFYDKQCIILRYSFIAQYVFVFFTIFSIDCICFYITYVVCTFRKPIVLLEISTHTI